MAAALAVQAIEPRDHPVAIRRGVTQVVDLVITDLGVFEIDKKSGGGMKLIELADGVTEDEIRSKTEADFSVALKG